MGVAVGIRVFADDVRPGADAEGERLDRVGKANETQPAFVLSAPWKGVASVS